MKQVWTLLVHSLFANMRSCFGNWLHLASIHCCGFKQKTDLLGKGSGFRSWLCCTFVPTPDKVTALHKHFHSPTIKCWHKMMLQNHLTNSTNKSNGNVSGHAEYYPLPSKSKQSACVCAHTHTCVCVHTHTKECIFLIIKLI